jgi:hypothetical protein
LKQRRLCQRGEARIWSGCNPDFAPGVFHGEKRFAEMAQRFEMAQQKCVQRFAVFDRSASARSVPRHHRTARAFLYERRSSSCPRIAVRKNGVAALAYVADIHVF